MLDIGAGRATVQVRGWRFAESFRVAGWQAEFVDVKDATEEELLAKARGVDVTYLIKVRSVSLIRRLKAQGSKVIFDLTDPVWEYRYRRGGWWHIDEILLLADAVFSENEFVCEYGRRFNERVFSIPVCTQVERFDEIRRTASGPPTDRVVIGWVGSTSTVSAVFRVAPVIEEVARHHPDVELRLVGTGDRPLPAWRHTRVSLVGSYDEETMIREILAMHIGIFPPPEDIADYRVRGAHKALLYMTGGVPPVAQNAGDCANKIRDGETGMLADSPAEWIQKLRRLVESPELRSRMGSRALASVRAEHSLINVFRALEAALDEVIALPPRPMPSILDVARIQAPLASARARHLWERANRRLRRIADRARK